MSDNPKRKSYDGVKWEAIGWILLAGIALWQTRPFDVPLPHFNPGAAFWPKVILAIMVVSALVLLVSRFLPQSKREEEEVPYLDEMPDDITGMDWRAIALFTLPVLWTFGMHKMGFLLATPIFLFIFTWLMGVRKWTTLIAFTLGFFALIVLVFYKLIFTSLPMGAGIFHSINGEILGWIQ